jgi:superfamily II DNA or RNA helicase
MAGQKPDHMRRVQIASIQTLSARCFRQGADLPPADIVFIDEAHHAAAKTYKQIIESYPNAKLIGMTATPCRRDGRGLGSAFSALIEGPQVEHLIAQGYLVPTKVFAPSKPNLKGVTVRHGDYVERELAERMDRAELVGDIVSHWHRLADRRPTVCFASSVAHSIHLKEEFCKSGVKAEHIDGSTPKDERDGILAQLSRGDLELVTNCMVLTEGWDQPSVEVCILARPTKSMGLYRQMAGRVIRPAPKKDHALILDHAGAVFAHGFIEDRVIWSLDANTKADTPAQTARKLTPSSRLLECSQCKAIRTAGEPCGHCGFMPKRPGEYVVVRNGQLEQLDRDGRLRPNEYSTEQRLEFYRGLLALALDRGNKPGAAAYRFKDRFGEWPPRHWTNLGPAKPSAEVMAWDRHCRIRFAKAMEKSERADG